MDLDLDRLARHLRERLLEDAGEPDGAPPGERIAALVDREAGVLDGWTRVMDASSDLYEALRSAGLDAAAPYAVAMAYRVRFYMEMNAREAMHVIELRTAPQGHPAYRRVCQQMHRLIADRARHTAIAAAMKFADHSEVELERLKAEREIERRRARPTAHHEDHKGHEGH